LENDSSDAYSFLILSGLDVYDLGNREGIIGKCIIIKKMLAEFDKEDFSFGRNNFWYKVRLFKKEIVMFIIQKYKNIYIFKKM
jgi:hypothetical protein